ncbi:uncharacterized protein N7482_002035 [Penicillium canariense]|uniref:Autophagy-related protein 27 n=1 Tax=Penicillium canariense TaxID=189055 RepID=A0A9W9IG99_9EURO|nr:uncharacterized protein N7482_002035 [Penicillium canariense]KAJ5176158.1 hypothetical protein N7482_002035 [Penicillium canariense]
MPASRPLSCLSSALALFSLAGTLLPPVSAAGRASATSGEGYRLGEEIPVSCLSRTMEGEHITDDLGKLEYIPFATCNETSRPLSLHYGTSETITCTISSLTDSLYHLLEFYVHSDVPMTCRVPTAPLTSSNTAPKDRADTDPTSGEVDSLAALSENGPPFTPVTIALQGTLQLSHLHIWTDMNMLMHNIASDAAAQLSKSQKHAQSGQPGYAVAGTAYSTPEFEAAAKKISLDEDEEAVTVAQAARQPWTAGHGTKVVRGEPLTFSFHVAWIEGGAGIGWPERPASESFLEMGGSGTSQGSGAGSFISRLFFFFLAASVGALAALYWERNGGRLRSRQGWRGDGILGAPVVNGKGAGVTFGNGGRINGYGGYSAATTANGAGTGGGGGTGYGGFVSGKRD